MKPLFRIVLTVVALVLFGCSSAPARPMYDGYTEAQLDQDAPNCHNGYCWHELAQAYFKIGRNDKGWSYMTISARDGYARARTAFINAGRPVPAREIGAQYH